MDNEKMPLFAAVAGGLLTTIGPLMPWLTATTGFGSLSRSGFDYGIDAKFIAGIGVVILLAGLATLGNARDPDWIVWGGALAAIVAIALTVPIHLELQDRVADFNEDNEFGIASIGMGLWVTYLGGILMGAATFIAVQAEKKAPAPVTPPLEAEETSE